MYAAKKSGGSDDGQLYALKAINISERVLQLHEIINAELEVSFSLVNISNDTFVLELK